MAKQCLVLPRELLEKQSVWQRFTPVDNVISEAISLSPEESVALVKLIAKHGVFMERYGEGGVEERPEWQQIIFYGLLTIGKNLFIYRRAPDEKYDEARLRDSYSAGVGGHIEPFDDSFEISIYRELGEELIFEVDGVEVSFSDQIGKVSIVGLIKDDAAEVGKVHLGLICHVALKEGVVARIREGENVSGEMISLQQYQELLQNPAVEIESWTRLMMKSLGKNLLEG